MQQTFLFNQTFKQKILDDVYLLKGVVNAKKMGRFRRGTAGVVRVSIDTIKDSIAVRVFLGKKNAFEKIGGRKFQKRQLADIGKTLKKWRSMSIT